MFDLLIDFWGYYNSLSKWFDDLFGDNFGFSDDSFGNHLRVGRVSLSDYFRLDGDVLGLNLCLRKIDVGLIVLVLGLLDALNEACQEQQGYCFLYHLLFRTDFF